MLLFTLALLILAPMILPASAAAKPTLVTGQTSFSNQQQTILRNSGNTLVVLITSQLIFTGDFQGTDQGTAIAIIDTSTGKLTFIQQTTFTGTVLSSKPGTVNILTIGNGILEGASQAYDVLYHGTGGLSGLHGEGNQATPAESPITTFSLKINFDQR